MDEKSVKEFFISGFVTKSAISFRGILIVLHMAVLRITIHG
jgi:hypothetical protein